MEISGYLCTVTNEWMHSSFCYCVFPVKSFIILSNKHSVLGLMLKIDEAFAPIQETSLEETHLLPFSFVDSLINAINTYKSPKTVLW